MRPDGRRRRRGGPRGPRAGRATPGSRSPWSCSTRTCRRWTASRWPSGSVRTRGWPGRPSSCSPRADHPGDAARCRELGIAASLLKPVKPSDLLAAIRSALRGPSPEAGPRASAPGPPEAPGRRGEPLRLLLAEDNPVNQKLAVRLLEKRGHPVEVAGNGQEALGVLEDQRVRPGADGRADARDGRASRRRPPSGSARRRRGRHVPIIAMTAHAMKGDRERCLAAGMDGYISKPIQAEELFDIVEGQAPPNALRRRSAGGRTGEGGSPRRRGAPAQRRRQPRSSCARSPSCSSTSSPKALEGIRRPSRPATPRRWSTRPTRSRAPSASSSPGRPSRPSRPWSGSAATGTWRTPSEACAALERELSRLGPALASLTAGGHAVKILVVEDDPIVRRLLRGHLEAWGHEVTQALDGAAGLGALQQATSPSSSATG